MVEMSKILEQVADVVRESGRVTGEIPESSDLYAEVGVESVNSIAILLALEEKFAITIDDTEFVKARTLTELVKLVAAQTGETT